VCVCWLCAIWPEAEMASCLVVAFWDASVFGSRWLGGKGAMAASQARSMQATDAGDRDLGLTPLIGDPGISENG
jgi:hypothetical protein